MKQSVWRERVEFLKAEMLKRGKEKNSPEILKQFSTRLSATILHFFAESDSFSPKSNLTVDQKAFTHSLQLYDFQSVMRLIVNYDVSKGMKVVIPGLEKSYISLMVIPRLERFIKNSLESSALSVYKFRLEDSLSRFLKCEREELYKDNFLIEKIEKVSSIPKILRDKFFTERLRTLFSSNYRTYLLLKNRYFLKLIFRYGNNPKNFLSQKELSKLPFNQSSDGILSIKKIEDNFDFRSAEQFVKEYIFKNYGSDSMFLDSSFLDSEDIFMSDGELGLKSEKNHISIPFNDKTFNHYYKDSVIFDSNDKLILEENISAYQQLCNKYEEPLKEMIASFCPIPECSSPYFRPRAEDYRIEFSNFFQQILGNNLLVVSAIQEFTLELLMQKGKEYNEAERWEMISMRKFDEKSLFYRKTKNGENFIDRKTEWSIIIQFCIPFDIKLPMGKNECIHIEKGKLCLFQIGTAFFDHGNQKKIEEVPDVFLKLMFEGHVLTSKNAVIYVENDPYFTITLQEIWHCRGFVYLIFIAISRRFDIELSNSLTQFLVEKIPKTIEITGNIPHLKSIPESLRFIEDKII